MDPIHTNPSPRWAPFALGFRPFFLLAGLAAVLLLGAWLALAVGELPPPAHYDLVGWHSHEMLFGYIAAVIAGFLLTAVRNWTGVDTPTGAPLAALAALWLLARLLPWLPGVPGLAVALVDLVFLPALALALAGPLRAGRNRMNLVMLPLLLAMTLANAIVHARALGWSDLPATVGTRLMLDLVLALVLLVGGRVMPFFTETGVAGARPRVRRPVELAGVVLMALLIALHLAGVSGAALAAVAGTMAAVQAARLAGWYQRGVFGVPILAVLYSGYAWLVAGFALHALAALGLFVPSAATHAFTVGALGVLTLGMMARVALGHTGRPMRSVLAIDVAFVLLNAAALVRVFLTGFFPAGHGTWLYLSGFLWLAAFLLFVGIYAPILLRPRADGNPG
ncbi:MAG: NnrS family protein [Gammaproteobacteria bacterium]|nr:NnrS family protein [Gammaproteobacteria bacterium]